MYTPVPTNVSEKSVRAGKLLECSYTVCASIVALTSIQGTTKRVMRCTYIHAAYFILETQRTNSDIEVIHGRPPRD